MHLNFSRFKRFPTQMTFIYTIGNNCREIIIKVLEIDPDMGLSSQHWSQRQEGSELKTSLGYTERKGHLRPRRETLSQTNTQELRNEITTNSPLTLYVWTV